MFQFSGFPSHDYVFIIRYLDITLSEFPHSEIFGSKFTCNSPKLIAAYHVLHRLREPRHPPYALSYFLYDCICHLVLHCWFTRQRISSSYFQLYSNKVKSHLAIWFTLVWTKVHYLQFCLCQYVKDLLALIGMVENNGFEPLTPCLQSRCSSQLS